MNDAVRVSSLSLPLRSLPLPDRLLLAPRALALYGAATVVVSVHSRVYAATRVMRCV